MNSKIVLDQRIIGHFTLLPPVFKVESKLDWIKYVNINHAFSFESKRFILTTLCFKFFSFIVIVFIVIF